MHKRKIDVSLWEFHDLVKLLGKEISAKHKVDTIVAVSRGGLVPARYLSKPLGVRRIHSLGIEFYDGTKQNEEANVYQKLTDTLYEQTVLIVDDIVDSGDSMQIALEEVRTMVPKEVFTCSLHYKAKSNYKPDFYGRQVCDDIWLKYDWE